MFSIAIELYLDKCSENLYFKLAFGQSNLQKRRLCLFDESSSHYDTQYQGGMNY